MALHGTWGEVRSPKPSAETLAGKRLTVPTQYSPYWLLPSMTVDNGAAAREFRFTFVLSSSSSSGRRRRGRDQREDPVSGREVMTYPV